MAITAAMVKELREISGAGMMDCKKALTATEGDMDKAMEFLREKGLATAQKKASRIAAEGIVMLKVAEDSQKAVAVEVNAETDFVAKTDDFQSLARDIAMQIAAVNPTYLNREEVPAGCGQRLRLCQCLHPVLGWVRVRAGRRDRHLHPEAPRPGPHGACRSDHL